MKTKHPTHAPTTLDHVLDQDEKEEMKPTKEHEDDDYNGNDSGLDFYGTDDFDDDYADVAHNNTQAFDECMIKGPSNIRVLKDEWSKSGKAPNCTFPFVHHGRIYYGCTDVEYGGRFWCANQCDYSMGEFLHRGECDIAKNTRGVALSALNLFVGLLFSVGFTVIFILCLVECCRRRSEKSGRVVDDEDAPIGQSVEMNERRMQVQ
jgi:Fibronectin type II domain